MVGSWLPHHILPRFSSWIHFCFVIWNVNSFSIFSLESFYFSYTSYKNAKNYFHTTFFRQKKIIALFHEIFIRAINVKENERVLLIIFRVVYSERIFLFTLSFVWSFDCDDIFLKVMKSCPILNLACL